MRKVICPVLGAALWGLASRADSSAQRAFRKATLVISGGPAYGRTKLIDVALNAEYGVHANIGLGLRASSGLDGYADWLSASLYANYHLVGSAKVDPFAGLGLGATNLLSRGEVTYSGFTVNLQTRVRYWLSSRVGMYTQLVLPFHRDAPAGLEVSASLKLTRAKPRL